MTEHNLFNVENPRDKLIKGLTSELGSKMTFAEVLTSINDSPELKAEFNKLTAIDVASLFKNESKPKRVKSKFPIVREDELDDYKKSIVDLLKTYGLGDSYGMSPIQIRMALGRGSELSMRAALKQLLDEQKISCIGVTKGLRYFTPEFAKPANKIYEDLKVIRLERYGK